MAGKSRAALPTIGRIVVSLGLLVLLVFLFRGKLPAAMDELRQLRPPSLLLAAAWYVLFIFISAWRWQVLLRARGLRFSTWYLARVFTLGLFFCKMLPTSIGGDVMRIAYTARKDKGIEAFSATFLDRLIGFVSLTFLAAVTALGLFVARGLWAQQLVLRKNPAGAVTLAMRGDVMFVLLLGVLAVLVLLALVLFSDHAHRLAAQVFSRVRVFGAGRLLDRAYDAVKQFRGHPGALALSFMSGIGVQTALSFAWFHTAQALGASVPLAYYLIFIPVLNIVVNIPSIGGLGVREWTFVALFTQPWMAGAMADHKAFAAAVLFLAVDLVFALAGGLVFAFMRRSAQPGIVAGAAEDLGARPKTRDRQGPGLEASGPEVLR